MSNKIRFTKPPQKKGSKKSLAGTWKKILLFCKKYWWMMISSFAAAIIGTVLMLLGPDKISELTKLITDGLLTGIDMQAVAVIGCTLIAFYGFSWLLSVIEQLLMNHVTQNVSKDMRSSISKKMGRLPMGYFHKTTTGDILSRVTNDVDTVSQSLNQSIGTLVSAITLFLLANPCATSKLRSC